MFRSLGPGAIGIRASLTEGIELAKAAEFQGLSIFPVPHAGGPILIFRM